MEGFTFDTDTHPHDDETATRTTEGAGCPPKKAMGGEGVNEYVRKILGDTGGDSFVHLMESMMKGGVDMNNADASTVVEMMLAQQRNDQENGKYAPFAWQSPTTTLEEILQWAVDMAHTIRLREKGHAGDRWKVAAVDEGSGGWRERGTLVVVEGRPYALAENTYVQPGMCYIEPAPHGGPLGAMLANIVHAHPWAELRCLLAAPMLVSQKATTYVLPDDSPVLAYLSKNYTVVADNVTLTIMDVSLLRGPWRGACMNVLRCEGADVARPGTPVMLSGLQATAFNGAEGVSGGIQQSSGRVIVRLRERSVTAKAANVFPVVSPLHKVDLKNCLAEEHTCLRVGFNCSGTRYGRSQPSLWMRIDLARGSFAGDVRGPVKDWYDGSKALASTADPMPNMEQHALGGAPIHRLAALLRDHAVAFGAEEVEVRRAVLEGLLRCVGTPQAREIFVSWREAFEKLGSAESGKAKAHY